MNRPSMLGAVAAMVAVLALPAALAAQSPAPRITLADALQMIEAAQKDAASKNYRLSFAVVDARGDVIAVARMPGAGAATPDTAIGKAMASAIYGQPSAALVARASSPITQGMNDATGGRFRLFQGALPIVRNGVMVGAMGASGASSQQDEDIVRIALADR